MVVGGDDGVQSLATTEIFDPKTKTWSPGPLLTEARETFALTSYGNTGLAAGGWDGIASDVTSTAELIVFGLADGSACQAGSVCASGFCANGVCCDSACTGTCTACTAKLKGTGMDGVCAPVEAGTDPLDQCTDKGAASCGTNGLCDGNGACGSYADGTVCLTQTECIVAVCASGVCGGPHQLDGSPVHGRRVHRRRVREGPDHRGEHVVRRRRPRHHREQRRQRRGSHAAAGTDGSSGTGGGGGRRRRRAPSSRAAGAGWAGSRALRPGARPCRCCLCWARWRLCHVGERAGLAEGATCPSWGPSSGRTTAW